MSYTKSRKIFTALLVLYLGLIAYLCFGKFSSDTQIEPSFFGIPTDKIVHFCMFLPFPILAWGTFRGIAKKPLHSLLLTIVLFISGCIIAGGTELGQGLTEYRFADSADFLADGLGLAVGAICALILDLRAAFKKQEPRINTK